MYLLKAEVEKLKKEMLSLSTIVEESVLKAMQAAAKRDSDIAREVIEADRNIDQMEVDLEEDCLKVLALHQPVAIDLRFIIAVLKINNDLERIGDLAVNIARRTIYLAAHPEAPTPPVLNEMLEKVRRMLRKSLDALVDSDAGMAREVLTLDDEVDEMHRGMFDRLRDITKNHPEQLEAFSQLLTISRNLERIADLATNIAEDVIYLIEGKIVRHSGDSG